jgi:hypothetical protein
VIARRAPLLLLGLALLGALLASCGDDDNTSPASADTCEELVDRAADVAAQVVTDFQGKSAADLDPGTAEDPYPELTRPFAPFEARAQELDCDRGELRRLACEAYQGIEPSGPATEELLAQLTELCT